MKKKGITTVIFTALLLSAIAGCKKDKSETGDVTATPEVSVGKEDGNVPEKPTGSYETFTEAELLRTQVKAKELPEVEKRLPVRADVVTESGYAPGEYGASVQFAAENADEITGNLVSEGLFRYGEDGSIVPNVAKAYTVNSDYTKYTIALREGLRWSDGVLFTADDCVFFYEKMCLKETFGEPLWQCFTVKNEAGRKERAVFKKLDAHSFEVLFPSPKPDFLVQLTEQGGICFAPEHYHVNLLPEYMGEEAANAKAKDMGYAGVTELLRESVVNAWNTAGVPTLNPYCLSTEEGKNDVDGDYYEFVRNPYYWKVDANGKQLPYMDCLSFTRISGEAQKMLLTTEGFLSVSELTAEQVPEAVAGAERGEYRVIKWTDNTSYAVKNVLKNFSETCPYEERSRGIGAAHPEYWYME